MSLAALLILIVTTSLSGLMNKILSTDLRDYIYMYPTYMSINTPLLSAASNYKMPPDFVIPNLFGFINNLYLLRPACNYFQLPTLTRQTYLGLGVDYQPTSRLPLAMPIHWMKTKQTIWVHTCD